MCVCVCGGENRNHGPPRGNDVCSVSLKASLEPRVCVCGGSACPDLSLEGVDDEMQGVRLNALDALLHHVIPVLILHTLQHVTVQLSHHLALRRDGKNL